MFTPRAEDWIPVAQTPAKNPNPLARLMDPSSSTLIK